MQSRNLPGHCRAAGPAHTNRAVLHKPPPWNGFPGNPEWFLNPPPGVLSWTPRNLGNTAAMTALLITLASLLPVSGQFPESGTGMGGPVAWVDATQYEFFRVKLPENPSPALCAAAEAFADYWGRVTGKPLSGKAVEGDLIYVRFGAALATEDLLDPALLSGLPDNGFVVRTHSPAEKFARKGATRQLLFAAPSDEAVLEGVRTFFHEVFETRWVEPGLTVVRPAAMRMPQVDIVRRPAFAFREVGLCALWKEGVEEYRRGAHLTGPAPVLPPGEDWFDAWNTPDGAAGTADVEPVVFGSEAAVERIAGELAALVAGPPEGGDATAAARRAAAEWPPASNQWSLNALSWLRPELDDAARELNQREGSPAACVLRTANGVAAALRARFPDRPPRVHVLLPPFLRRPPAALRAEEGVVVQLSNADADFSLPAGSPRDPANRAFGEDVRGWTRTGAEVWALDHLCNGRDPALPFPCLEALADSVFFYVQSGVRGVCYAGAPARDPGAVDLAALRMYLAAGLLWDPDAIVENMTAEFLRLYYGGAADAVREYLDLTARQRQTGGRRIALNDDGGWLDRAALAPVAARLERDAAAAPDPAVRARAEALARAVRRLSETGTAP